MVKYRDGKPKQNQNKLKKKKKAFPQIFLKCLFLSHLPAMISTLGVVDNDKVPSLQWKRNNAVSPNHLYVARFLSNPVCELGVWGIANA